MSTRANTEIFPLSRYVLSVHSSSITSLSSSPRGASGGIVDFPKALMSRSRLMGQKIDSRFDPSPGSHFTGVAQTRGLTQVSTQQPSLEASDRQARPYETYGRPYDTEQAPEPFAGPIFAVWPPHNGNVAKAPTVHCRILTRKRRKPVWYVSVCVGGKQRQKQYPVTAEGEAKARELQAAWVAEVMGLASVVRERPTRLTLAKLRAYESLDDLLVAMGWTQADVLRLVATQATVRAQPKLFSVAVAEYLAARKGRISERQYGNYSTVLNRFSVFLGKTKNIGEVTTADVDAFLKGLGVGPKSWNNYRDDLSSFFGWGAKAPRRWLSDNPVEAVERNRARDVLTPGGVRILSAVRAAEVMTWLETQRPHLVPFFAVTLFAGVRTEQEMARLARDIGIHGLGEYLREGTLYMTAQQTKDGRPRGVPFAPNLLAWLVAYPLTAASCLPPGGDEYTVVRSELGLAHNVLRHTSVSACAALHGITEAAMRHGNSERIIRDRYLARVSKEEAQAFYSIMPRTAAKRTHAAA